MKEKILILTLCGNYNYGNKLQNYALKRTLEKLNFTVYSGWRVNSIIKFNIKNLAKKMMFLSKKYNRYSSFEYFTKKYLNVKRFCDGYKMNRFYQFCVIGSDQVWNYNLGSFSEFFFAPFSDKSKNIAYAASIGVDYITDNYLPVFKKGLANFKAISVREDSAKKIVVDITGRNDLEVVLDPTMLLTSNEWKKIMKKPKMLKDENYILSYFLGTLSEERKKEIERVAKENHCKIINLLDNNSDFYTCGPSEFLYLEKNAFLICTDSFHSSVFAFLFDKPFVLFDREDKVASMRSRLDTLIHKLELKNRFFEGKITEDNLKHDYSQSYQLLDNERKKSMNFLKKALNIEGEYIDE